MSCLVTSLQFGWRHLLGWALFYMFSEDVVPLTQIFKQVRCFLFFKVNEL